MFGRLGRRRRGADGEPFPDAWRQRLAVRWATWQTLDDAERHRVEHLSMSLIDSFRWEAAQGFTMTDEMRVLVSAQASLLALGLDDDVFRRVTSVILHPRTVVLRGARHVEGGLVSDSPYSISGQAHHRGPIVLAWSTVAYEARHPDRGQNVVYHEFAHQLDMLDGTIDGMPPIRDSELRERWVRACTAEYQAIRRGEERVLREYAGVDTGEFFAVATETFFSTPLAVRDEAPALYSVLADFYRQDPAARLERAHA